MNDVEETYTTEVDVEDFLPSRNVFKRGTGRAVTGVSYGSCMQKDVDLDEG